MSLRTTRSVARSGMWGLALLCCMGMVLPAGAGEWHDPFYQYRIPLTFEASEPGWHEVPLTSGEIVTAINATEELKFDPRWFAHNHLLSVALDKNGSPTGEEFEAGLHLIVDERELLGNDILSGPDVAQVPVEPGALYLLRYSAAGAGRSPILELEPVFPVLHSLRKLAALTSYEPRTLPLARVSREVLIIPNTARLPLHVKGRFVTGVDKISLRRADIRFLANLLTAGRQRVMLYYQPMTGHYLTIPQRRHPNLPPRMAVVTEQGAAEKYYGKTRHPIVDNDSFTAWFAETTVKLTPSTLPPTGKAAPIRIAAAANEAQSFQLVLRPKRPVEFRGAVASDLVSGEHRIAADRVSVMQIAYVPITAPSYLTPVTYRGSLADPLLPLAPKQLNPVEGNFALWVTVRVPPGTPKGRYTGSIIIEQEKDAAVKLPLALEVFDFELPEFSPFRSSMGGPHLTKTIDQYKTIADYHQAFSRDEIRTLSRNYFDVMAQNKFTPHNVVQYSKIGMKWSPPPQGMNVDAPGNFFKLHDWDFTEFNEDLRHYVDDLKVNAFTLVHTNPSVITMFKHLPGKELKAYNRHPQHSTLDWQNWREATFVGYDKREGDEYQEITKAQFDNLLMQFYRRIAQNLEEHGWLDHAYILIDETAYRGYEPFLDFIRLLKSDPLTARIKIAWCTQSMAAFNHKRSPGDSDYAFNNLLDIYVPETNENNPFWEKYYFTDYNVKPTREKVWNYITYSTRVAIDTPGINNRAIAMEVFNNGGGGFLIWASFIWDSRTHHESNHDNPWEQPWTRWGNGAMAYFYPPHKAGVSPKLDLTVIPSLRVMTYREGVDDYEYAWLLEREIESARSRGMDVSSQQQVLDDVQRIFVNAVHWSQNDAWYLELRHRMAKGIVALRHQNDQQGESK